jgi:hypothetical protein
VNKLLRYVGLMACFVALLAMNGGHWMALQSVAWARMIVVFSQRAPLKTALARTFDGQHPCSLCLQVQKGWQQEQQQEKKFPMLKLEKSPELFWELRQLTAPPVPVGSLDCAAFVPDFHLDFIDSPPSPPPRPS